MTVSAVARVQRTPLSHEPRATKPAPVILSSHDDAEAHADQ